MQDLVNQHPEGLNATLLEASESLRGFGGDAPTWVSPLARDNYCEYQDCDFLEMVGQSHLCQALSEFWPHGGPVWDGLATVRGRGDQGGVLLLEAKSHPGEMASACGAGARSLERITRALDRVKGSLGVAPQADWLNGYYQYANRLAHLWWIREQGVPAWLVFLYFTGDTEMGGPDDKEGW